MRKISGIVFDSLAFARDAGEISGRLAVKDLPRLSEFAAEDGGTLNCQLRGGRSEEGRHGRPCLWLKVTGELRLTCQRCLQPLLLPLQVDSRLLLIAEGATWPDEELVDDSADAIAAQEEQSLASLVEDEVLLALPFAPRHESCELPAGGGENEKDKHAASPFAALVRVK